VRIGHAAGQKVQLQPGHRVPGVGAAIDFHYSRNGVLAAGGFAQLIDDFENDPAFAFVTRGDAGVGDELRGEFCEHVC
jgi:hypothetical protein